MTRWLRKLDTFWFADVSAAVLSVLRITLGTYSLIYLINRHGLLVRMARTDESLFAPVGLAALLNQPLPPVVVEAILALTLTLSIPFILGWGYRYSGPAFALLLMAVLCYRNSWSMIFHSDNLLVLHILVLGFVRAADCWSIDSLARTMRHRLQGRSVPSMDCPPRRTLRVAAATDVQRDRRRLFSGWRGQSRRTARLVMGRGRLAP